MKLSIGAVLGRALDSSAASEAPVKLSYMQ